MSSEKAKKILIYEGQLWGHHPSYLRLVSRAFLDSGHRVVLAVCDMNLAQELLGEELSRRCQWLKASPPQASHLWKELDECVKVQSCDELFFNCLDELLPNTLRRAALGIFPPQSLKGKVSGVFVRPKCLDPDISSFKETWKRLGLKRLSKLAFFNKIFVLDERLMDHHRLTGYPHLSLNFLPDPWEYDQFPSPKTARQQWGLSDAWCVNLFYGTGSRRKGLDLALAAHLSPECPKEQHLFCVGKMDPDPALTEGLQQLVTQGRATWVNRYVSTEEELSVFAACDRVLLPYRGHYGSSGILPRAAAAGKPVLASDEGLVGWRVKKYGLGEVFEKEKLGHVLIKFSDHAEIRKNLLEYSVLNSSVVFREGLSRLFLKIEGA
jgi:hypothetical protein